MIRDTITRHPLLVGIVLVPLTFLISLFVSFFALMLLDGLLMGVGLEGGTLFRILVAPMVSIASALACSGYVALWLRERAECNQT